ncbi:hypothetical protein J4H39_23245 [Vibrio alginolyticus]|uniref:Uncharacterized protein n=1 Tax=Vibrio alginolyticus TaxID=663 RepID=A0A7Y0N147_VIBAL|nr:MULTISPECIES: MbeD/MobD family mobilization/exclusion protein [Vibrio]MBT0000154.1 hypothetical protein [Vibrio alginolyticus]MCA2486100.1 hypothetical protein [Vibrio alginolyticus]MDF4961719.1 MbeD/MobD family mobilization/exclusion protein [Vibrio parahaemolyticus]MDF4976463.1 MbeD/MobD family mobilization/exclusion protein [Vibrio parahaemolyticus]MDF5048764.1 MbeD/MobD family mobilization/exclusion protein [Vibrio parahaemolyticus]
MTELETLLLNEFEQLQTQHEIQQKEFVNLYNDLAEQLQQLETLI